MHFLMRITGFSGNNPAKALVSVGFGLALASVGMVIVGSDVATTVLDAALEIEKGEVAKRARWI